jgi:predicted chitinase
VKYAGTGWIQVTGRYNHQAFSDYLQKTGEFDHKIMEVGKTYTSDKYPWSISGFWWYDNGMIDFCKTNPPVDKVGARVNGRYLPNGYEDRRHYTAKAFKVLGL